MNRTEIISELLSWAKTLEIKQQAATLPPNPDVRAIVKAYLEAEGYDGLFAEQPWCNCAGDDLFAHCSSRSMPAYCKAGYRVDCDPTECCTVGWHIGPDKQGVQDKPTLP